jgi:hypothetical protein
MQYGWKDNELTLFAFKYHLQFDLLIMGKRSQISRFNNPLLHSFYICTRFKSYQAAKQNS